MSVLSFTEARRKVEVVAATLEPLGKQRTAISASRGRVLATRILADRNLPPFPRATRDGFAVRSEDVLQAPVKLRVVGEISAGVDPATVVRSLEAGCAVEIMTGASLPAGADAVVMVEYTASTGGGLVEVQRGAVAGENVVATGAEAHAGEVLLKPGTRLEYAAIATAASVGCTEIEVYQRPRVAILSTGNEIVETSAQPGPYQIRSSNSHSLAAQVEAAGGEPVILPIAPDESSRLRELLSAGLRHDLLLITGGVSMGKHDLVEPVLAELKAEFHFTGALIQPGKPIVFGQAAGDEKVPFFGLPGNPVSTMVCFELFVRPVLDALSGARPRALVFTRAKLAANLKTKTGLTRFLPAVIGGELSESTVDLVGWEGSGDVVATARANCYIVVPPDREQINAGEYVSILHRGVEL